MRGSAEPSAPLLLDLSGAPLLDLLVRETRAVPDVAEYWDEQAAAFDDAPDHGLGDLVTRSALASLLALLMPAAPARIADVGCGTGSLAVLLAEAGYQVSGLDLAPGDGRPGASKAAQPAVTLSPTSPRRLERHAEVDRSCPASRSRVEGPRRARRPRDGAGAHACGERRVFAIRRKTSSAEERPGKLVQ